MKRLIKANSMDNYKDFWAYQRIIDGGYKVEVTKGENQSTVKILFEDGDVYTTFKIKKEEGFFGAYDDGCLINENFDYDDTMEHCICECLAFFVNRY